MRCVSVLLGFLFCIQPVFRAPAMAQTGQTPAAVSDRLGEIIDLSERNRDWLCQNLGRFQPAAILANTGSRYLAAIRSAEANGEEQVWRLGHSEEVIRKAGGNFGALGLAANEAEPVVRRMTEPVAAVADTLVSIRLKSGSTLKGHLLSSNASVVKIRTLDGLVVEVPRTAIVKITRAGGRMARGEFRRFDPNYSRLLFAPTGRPLRRGDGYFADFYVFFPSVAYGLTDNLSIMGGMSILPGLSLGEQLKYVAPRAGVNVSETFAISVGALYTGIKDEFAAGIAFATATLGPQDRHFTFGLGLGYTRDENENGASEFHFAEHPVIVLGGNIRLSNNLALLTENWFITGGNFEFSEQPFTLALRFFGDRLAVDAGAIFIKEVLEEGFPVPWLSFVYNFGPR